MVRKLALTSVCLCLTLFFFGPSHLFFYNSLDFTYSYSEAAFGLAAISLSVFIAIFMVSFLLSLISSSLHARIVAILFILSLLFWLQGNLLIWDYGPLHGQAIDWDSKRVQGWIDVALWGSLLLAASMVPRRIQKAAFMGSMAIILAQLISFGYYFVKHGESHSAEMRLSNETEFSFSSSKNIIILVLDAFQADIFEELIKSDDKLKEPFDGFTFFRNSVGSYISTYTSLSYMLTGKYYDNAQLFVDYLAEAFSENSIPKVLKENNFDVYLPNKLYIYSNEDISSNYSRRTKEYFNINKARIANLLEVSLFRYSPHFVKKIIFNRILTKQLVTHDDSKKHVDIVFMERAADESAVRHKENALRFYHLSSLHPPLRLNENLEYEEMGGGWPYVRRAAIASIKIVNSFLETLKKLDIYDNSMIFIVGDHGFGSPQQGGPFSFPLNMGFVNPLILAKPFDSRGPLESSDVPVAAGDIRKTIFDELGIENEADGYSLFKAIPADRKRKYYSTDKWFVWENGYDHVLSEYEVNGFSWDRSSWCRTYRDFAPGKLLTSVNKYSYGTEILFGEGGNARNYKEYGWFVPSGAVTWVHGREASIVFDIEPPETDLIVTMKAKPNGKVGSQLFVVEANGIELTRGGIVGEETLEFIVPRKYVEGKSSLRLTLDLINVSARMPNGLAVYSMLINEN